jgi:hypothetical protein
MARSINDIQTQIINQVAADPVLKAQLTSTSKVAIWRLWTYVVAVCIWTLETLFDVFRTETDEKIASMKPHSLRWYALTATAFQYGFNLAAESDYYNNTGIDDATIDTSKIVAYAAVVEQTRGLRIKVAKDTGDLAPLASAELDAFKEYMSRVKDAGVKLLITSGAADSLKLTMDIYYNPLVLNAAGSRADGVSANPVQDAVKLYLKNLPFNGVFLLQNLVDVLQAVDGVRVIDIKQAQAQYGALAYTAFSVQYIPDAGYLRVYNDTDLQLTFIPYSE